MAGLDPLWQFRQPGESLCGRASGQYVVNQREMSVFYLRIRHEVESITQIAFTRLGVEILLCSLRNQAMGSDLFTNIGIDLAAKKLIVVKSSQHFYASFAKVAKKVIYVAAPGAVTHEAPLWQDSAPAQAGRELVLIDARVPHADMLLADIERRVTGLTRAQGGVDK